MDNGVGTATLLELVHAFRQLSVEEHLWHPGASIVFASWSGEEFGKIGSTEFLEQFGGELRGRAVAYVNVDAPVRGDHALYVAASPLAKSAIYASARAVPCPSPAHGSSKEDGGGGGVHSMYDQWLEADAGPDVRPRVNYLNFHSDTMGFFLEGGITSISPSYR
ncbi:PREDICTED: N-acetylated-alpha-linked acidic dipeptidase 2-like [Priapulus caudatus]|uniref:N-acetylated-alpha-linked acidic dipeptidase 2-like n=1 Tax=Priapulus caudatus TaxID=37621 RepID=A0ABM1DU84_PRICU|nr:PREDICTED: N-acetylated-alpha-linked acidic dipeptidase 2-like [Priapulus caudatus]